MLLTLFTDIQWQQLEWILALYVTYILNLSEISPQKWQL